MNEALRDWAASVVDTHYVLGSVAGPHPFPGLVRDLQRVIGDEAKRPDPRARGPRSRRRGRLRRRREQRDRDLRRPSCRTRTWVWSAWRRAAGGTGSASTAGRSRSASRACSTARYSYLCRTRQGQVVPTHSISAGLDYPGVGPEHAYLKDSGRATYVSVTDAEALEGFRALADASRASCRPSNPPTRSAGSCVARSPRARSCSSTCRAAATRTSKPCGPRSARSRGRRVRDLEAALRARSDAGGRAFVPYVTGGLAGVDADLLRGLEEAGADAIEVGIPFSDPVMDGPVIQEASRRALEDGATPVERARHDRGGRARRCRSRS